MIFRAGNYPTIALAVSAVWLVLGMEVRAVRADGGTIRFSQPKNGGTITVFTDPTPLRVGPIDVSVLIQSGESNGPLAEAPLVVRAYPIHDPQNKISAAATRAAATNKLLQAAQLKLSSTGAWRVEVSRPNLDEKSPIAFDVEVLAAFPPWLDLAAWITWPLLVVGLFLLHQLLDYRRRSRLAPAN